MKNRGAKKINNKSNNNNNNNNEHKGTYAAAAVCLEPGLTSSTMGCSRRMGARSGHEVSMSAFAAASRAAAASAASFRRASRPASISLKRLVVEGVARMCDDAGVAATAAVCSSRRRFRCEKLATSRRALRASSSGSCSMMTSARLKGSSVMRSFQFFALRFSSATASYAYTLPVGRTAQMRLLSLKTLQVTGQCHFPSAFLAMFRGTRSLRRMGSEVMGLHLCSCRYGRMFSRSKMTPSTVHMGC